jgi:aminopeptidase N
VLAVSSACAGATTEVTIEQDRFLTTPGARPERAQVWTVPVCFKAFPDSPPSCHVISKSRETLSVPGCAAEAFINAGSVGYFFSEYAPDVVRALSRKARGTLAAAERLGLIGDEWWLVRAGRHDIGTYFDLASALASDDTPAVTQTLSSHVEYAGEYLVADAQRPQFEKWINGRFGPPLDRLGFPGSGGDELQASRRAVLFELVGVWGNSAELQSRARDLATKYIDDPASLPGTLAPNVLRVAAYRGDAALYDRYVGRLKQLTAEPEEYYRFFNALPYFRDPALIAKTLDFSLSPEVRSQDSATLIARLLTHPWGRDAAWTFVKKQWPLLTEKMGTFMGIPIIISATGNFCSRDAAADVKTFFASHPVEAAERGIRQAIERIESCATLHARQSEPLSRWLAGHL